MVGAFYHGLVEAQLCRSTKCLQLALLSVKLANKNDVLEHLKKTVTKLWIFWFEEIYIRAMSNAALTYTELLRKSTLFYFIV